MSYSVSTAVSSSSSALLPANSLPVQREQGNVQGRKVQRVDWSRLQNLGGKSGGILGNIASFLPPDDASLTAVFHILPRQDIPRLSIAEALAAFRNNADRCATYLREHPEVYVQRLLRRTGDSFKEKFNSFPNATVEYLMTNGHRVTTLDLSGMQWSPATMRTIVTLFPQLRSLDLSGSELKGTTVAIELGKLTHLRHLNLSRSAPATNFSLIDLTPLAACTKLQYLNLAHHFFIDDITPLSTCTELEHLDLSNTNIGNITALATCTKLQDLFLNECRTITTLAPLGMCTQLKHLELERATCLADLNPLAAMGKLQTLRITYAHNIKDLTPLGACTNLRHLDLDGCTEPDNIEPLQTCTKLQYLKISSCFNITNFTPLRRCTELRDLFIHDPARGEINDLSAITIDRTPVNPPCVIM